ncbi:RluA family pseudouridine synthase [Patescibacteria group bacterium]|nr:RluA family pseudouridine synthase [Patescibacteria group bacterium]
MELKILYEDGNILGIEKPAGIIVYPERPIVEKTLIDHLLKNCPDLKNVGKAPRYGIIHRLDRDTSGILLIAKNNKTLNFLQKQFKEGKVTKKYLALVIGNIKQNFGEIKTLIGRSLKNRKKQRAYLIHEPRAKKRGKRLAITEYSVLKRFKNYTLVEVVPKTGRHHQIRTHLAYLFHPIAGDELYRFKNQPRPKDLKRQFLHASYLKIKLPDGKEKELKSKLPEDLKKILKNLISYGS